MSNSLASKIGVETSNGSRLDIAAPPLASTGPVPLPNILIDLNVGLIIPKPKPPKKPAAAASPNCLANSLSLYNSSKLTPVEIPAAVLFNVSCIPSARPSPSIVKGTSFANVPGILFKLPLLPFLTACTIPFRIATLAASGVPKVLITAGTTPPIPILSTAAYGTASARDNPTLGSSTPASLCARVVSPNPNI